MELADNLARSYLCEALRQRQAHTATPEIFNDDCDLRDVLDVLGAAIEIVRADLGE